MAEGDERLEEIWSRLLSGELSAEALAELEAELSRTPEGRLELEQLRRDLAALRDLPAGDPLPFSLVGPLDGELPELPAGFHEHLLAIAGEPVAQAAGEVVEAPMGPGARASAPRAAGHSWTARLLRWWLELWGRLGAPAPARRWGGTVQAAGRWGGTVLAAALVLLIVSPALKQALMRSGWVPDGLSGGNAIHGSTPGPGRGDGPGSVAAPGFPDAGAEPGAPRGWPDTASAPRTPPLDLSLVTRDIADGKAYRLPLSALTPSVHAVRARFGTTVVPVVTSPDLNLSSSPWCLTLLLIDARGQVTLLDAPDAPLRLSPLPGLEHDYALSPGVELRPLAADGSPEDSEGAARPSPPSQLYRLHVLLTKARLSHARLDRLVAGRPSPDLTTEQRLLETSPPPGEGLEASLLLELQ